MKRVLILTGWCLAIACVYAPAQANAAEHFARHFALDLELRGAGTMLGGALDCTFLTMPSCAVRVGMIYALELQRVLPPRGSAC